MTALLILAGVMLASLALALVVGQCLDQPDPPLHDGATMRADLTAANRAAEDEARAAFYDKFGRGGV